MKAAIIYFSGTGNTYRVGELYKDLLEGRGFEVDFINVALNYSSVEGYDLLIFGSPTYSKVASAKVIEFVDKYVKHKDNKLSKVITFVTYSWGEAYGHIVLAKELEKRGFEVSSSVAHLMPNNHYSMTGKKQTEFERKKLYIDILEKTKDVINSYDNGEKVIDTRSYLKRIGFGKMYKMLQKKWIPTYANKYLEVDSSKCTKCNLCVKKCPNTNIHMENGKITFESKCLACTKCFNNCPVNAYAVNEKVIECYDANKNSIKSKLEI